ncbi:MAG: hypothetical protein E5W59_13360, partial [Mesorhizobium sp.]
MTTNGKAEEKKKINIALQGGGSHGAFSWGVLDRLLEDGRLEISAVSGTSAGAMNAVALADGFVRGGVEGARKKLDDFWRAVARKGRFSPVQRMPWDVAWGNWSIENTPGYVFFDTMSRVFSPYVANPLGLNPLRDVVKQEINFSNVRACKSVELFISATNVETGQLRVFSDGEIDLDTVMASACLPQLFRAVEIKGVPYWDGGYGGNPALYPFFKTTATEDVLLVQINPVVRDGTPKSANEIQNRIDEITFNAGLLREFRSIAFVKELIAAGRVKVNGKVLSSPAFNVMPDDIVHLDGMEIPKIERTRLFLFHKPAGVVTTNRDPEGRKTVFDVLPAELPRLMTIGRLDINTEGLLLLTNDGGLSRVLELPATGWLRRYRVRVHGKVEESAL